MMVTLFPGIPVDVDKEEIVGAGVVAVVVPLWKRGLREGYPGGWRQAVP
jgi:hypothetical protein